MVGVEEDDDDGEVKNSRVLDGGLSAFRNRQRRTFSSRNTCGDLTFWLIFFAPQLAITLPHLLHTSMKP